MRHEINEVRLNAVAYRTTVIPISMSLNFEEQKNEQLIHQSIVSLI